MPKTFIDSIAIQIRHNRESRNLSQEEMAKAINIGFRSYQRIESGESSLSIEILYKIAKYLDIPLEHFVNPSLYLPKNDQFLIYKDLEHFLKNEEVKKSGIFEISKNPMAQEIFLENNIDKFINMKEFYDSPYPLAISDTKWSILNLSAQKLINSPKYRVPTRTGHSSQERLGKIWGTLIKNNIQYFQDTHIPIIGTGQVTITSECIFIRSKMNYFVLSFMRITSY